MERKKVLVTGGNGFIGSHIVDLLLKKKYKVVVISKTTPTRFKNPGANISHYKIDLKNYKEIERCLELEQPEIICHHAVPVSYVRESFLYPEKTLQEVLYAINLFEVAKKFNVRHIIFPSSTSVYHNYKNYFYKESSKQNPLSPLAVSKLMIEKYIEYLQRTTDIVWTTFRYFNVFGPRQRLSKFAGIIPNLIDKAMKNEEITIFGDGNQTRDFAYVGDIARANLMAIENPVSGIFNIGSGKGISINTLIATVEKLTGKKIRKKYVESTNEITNSVADISKIKRALRWKPRVSLTQGLKETIEYYKNFSV